MTTVKPLTEHAAERCSSDESAEGHASRGVSSAYIEMNLPAVGPAAATNIVERRSARPRRICCFGVVLDYVVGSTGSMQLIVSSLDRCNAVNLTSTTT